MMAVPAWYIQNPWLKKNRSCDLGFLRWKPPWRQRVLLVSSMMLLERWYLVEWWSIGALALPVYGAHDLIYLITCLSNLCPISLFHYYNTGVWYFRSDRLITTQIWNTKHSTQDGPPTSTVFKLSFLWHRGLLQVLSTTIRRLTL